LSEFPVFTFASSKLLYCVFINFCNNVNTTALRKLLIVTPNLGRRECNALFISICRLVVYLPVHGFVTRGVDEVQRAADSGNPDITPV
jgi:hypothetical protein